MSYYNSSNDQSSVDSDQCINFSASCIPGWQSSNDHAAIFEVFFANYWHPCIHLRIHTEDKSTYTLIRWCSGFWYCLGVLIYTDGLEKNSASIFMANGIMSTQTPQKTWRWTQHIPLQWRCQPTNLHSVKTQKTAMKAWKLLLTCHAPGITPTL